VWFWMDKFGWVGKFFATYFILIRFFSMMNSLMCCEAGGSMEDVLTLSSPTGFISSF
jgi:hypothetical protein